MADELASDIDILDRAVSSDDPKNRQQAAELINKKIESDKDGHMNTQTQWAPLIFSLLGRDYKGALSAWNGGPTREVEAYGPDNTRYVKQYNARGFTGRVFDPNGNELDAKTVQSLDKEGGLISREDVTAAQTGGFQAGRQGVLTFSEITRKPALEAYEKAQKVATSSSGIANLYKERSDIVKQSPWMDAMSKLSANERSKLFQLVGQQLQAQQGQTTEAGRTSNVSAGQQTGVQQGQTANFGADVGLKGAIPPGQPAGQGGTAPGRVGISPGVSSGVGGSSGSFQNTQGAASAGASTGAGTSASSGTQQQQTFRSMVEGMLQSKLEETDFKNLQRYIQLTTQLDEAQQKRGVQDLAPGAAPVPAVDYALSGRQNAALADYQGMKNEALLSAWNHYLAGKVHSARGKPLNMQALSEEFQQTTVARGISNRYDRAMNTIRTGQKYEPQEGDVIVDNRNKPLVWRNGKWSGANE